MSEKKDQDFSPFTIEKFFEFLEEEKLMAAECCQCGFKYIPPRPICTNCYSRDLKWVQINEKGRLISFTIIYVSTQEFENLTPYAYGIVELQDRIRLPGIIKNIEFKNLKIGMELVVEYYPEKTEKWPKWPKYFFQSP